MNNLDKNRFSELLIILFVVSFIGYTFMIPTHYDAGDSIQHYLVAKGSWLKPELFLDLWGKPVYTFFMSPFAQLGYWAVQIFNTILTALALYFTILCLRKNGYINTWILIPFSIFANINFVCINTGLTEPMFGFWLAMGAYLFFNEKYFLGSLFISFIPFVRAEGYIMLPLFGLILLWRKQWKRIPLLLFGYAFLSVIGFFQYKDLFWIRNKNPYNGDNLNEYGRGTLTFFVEKFDYVLGYPLGILVVIGLAVGIAWIYRNIKSNALQKKYDMEVWLLLCAPFILYFAAHIYFWWKGGYDSYGLVRVFAGVATSGASIAFVGLNHIVHSRCIADEWGKWLILCCSLVIIISKPFMNPAYTLDGLRPELACVKQATDWAKANTAVATSKVYAMYPLVPLELNLNTYDDKRFSYLWGLQDVIQKHGTNFAPDGSLWFWDSGFAKRDARFDLSTLTNNSGFELLKIFYKPKNSIDTSDFKLYIFRKNRTVETNSKSIKNNSSYSEAEVLLRIEKIKNTPQWMDKIMKDAKSRNITIDSMLYEDAVWSLDFDKKK